MLTNPEARRGLRAVIQAISGLVGFGFIGWLIYLLQSDNASLLKIAMALLGIAAMRELFYGAENVGRAKWELNVAGNKFSGETDSAVPVQVVNPPEQPVPVEPQS